MVALLLFGVAGCGGNPEGEMKKTVSIQEANERLDAYVQQAKSALSPTAELELKGQSKDAPCDDPSDNGAKGRVVADRSYLVKGLTPGAVSTYFDTLKAWSQAQNFNILEEKVNPQYLWIEKRDDGFRLALDSNDLGEVYLNGSSPCVWRNGTPETTG